MTYAELLRVFWESHRPDYPGSSRQYRSAIFYHTDQQRQLAIDSKADQEAEIGKKLYTDIEPFQTFYLAEDYHQKYTLQQRGEFFQELSEIYPDMEDLVNSTAAARLNGYLAGQGSSAQLQDELESLGLSESAQKRLVNSVKAFGK